MWIIALIGAGSSIIECTLAQIYKVKGEYGFRGGPAYYMEKGLKQRWLGILFSVLLTVTFASVFNSVQANTISLAFKEAFSCIRDFARQKREKKDPVFTVSKPEEYDGVECWESNEN